MNTTHIARRGIGSLACALAIVLSGNVRALGQGSLTPPGAPAATMKTLAQIEPRTPISALPFIVTAPGSYFLTGSLTAAASAVGIVISADNVTIDLSGFEVIGSPGASVVGIRLGGGFTNAVVRNGTVRNWTGSGMGSNGGVLHVENVRLRNNGGSGVSFGVRGSAIDCVAEGNGAHGFTGAEGCRLTRCTAYGQIGATSDGFNLAGECILTECAAGANARYGFNVGQRGLLRQCIATSNTEVGIFGLSTCNLDGCISFGNGGGGITTDIDSTLTGCSAQNNAGIGFSIGGNSALTRCTAYANTSSGIIVGEGSTVAHCAAHLNGGNAGISGGFGCTISDSSSRSNTSAASTSWGIIVAGESTVIHCIVTNTANTNATASPTTGGGINASLGSHVRECTVQGSKGDGIRVSSRCTVAGNQCDTNGNSGAIGAGIRTTGTQTRIEGNHVSFSGDGFAIAGSDHLIIRNTAAANTTNYTIGAGNRYGPIIDLTANNPATVSGNSAPDTSGTTHPWANFAY